MKRKYKLSQKVIKEWKELMEKAAEIDYSGYSDQKLRKEAYEWFDNLYSPKRPRKRRKRTKLFYKTIAIIRLNPNAYISASTLKKMFRIGYIRAAALSIELKDKGIIARKKDFSPPKILWENVKKIRVPKEISDTIKKELDSGKINLIRS